MSSSMKKLPVTSTSYETTGIVRKQTSQSGGAACTCLKIQWAASDMMSVVRLAIMPALPATIFIAAVAIVVLSHTRTTVTRQRQKQVVLQPLAPWPQSIHGDLSTEFFGHTQDAQTANKANGSLKRFPTQANAAHEPHAVFCSGVRCRHAHPAWVQI